MLAWQMGPTVHPSILHLLSRLTAKVAAYNLPTMKGLNIFFLSSLIFSADAFSVSSPPAQARHHRGALPSLLAHPATVDMDTMCMMNLAEFCASGESESCDVEDREALAEWMQERKREMQRQADDMATLGRRLVHKPSATALAPSPSRRDVQSLMNSISACLSLEEVGSFA
jgi:hypothetical protein